MNEKHFDLYRYLKYLKPRAVSVKERNNSEFDLKFIKNSKL